MDEIRAGDAVTVAPHGTIPVQAAAMTLVGVAAAMFVLREMRLFAAPILVSVLLAYAIEPLVDVFMRCRLPRAAAVVAAALVIAIGSWAGGRAARRQANAFLDALPTTIGAIKQATLQSDDGSADAGPGVLDRLRRGAEDLQAVFGSARPPSDPRVKRVAAARSFDVRDLVPSWDQLFFTGARRDRAAHDRAAARGRSHQAQAR